MLAQPAGDDAIGLGETGLPCTLGIGGKARCEGGGGETFGIGRLTVYIWNWPFDRAGKLHFGGKGRLSVISQIFPATSFPCFAFLSINPV